VNNAIRQEDGARNRGQKQKTFAIWLTRPIRPARTKESKSFLVLFFKKELLP